jgi:lipopolysaccharide transport system ATP-binding protein
MSEKMIDVKNVSKKFCTKLSRSLWYGLQDMGSELTARKNDNRAKLRPSEFWANSDVSFEVKRGECVGLIGRNGAGKTTLLKMLNGLIKPDRGTIAMHGRVGAMIALGAGFHPILTGRENIYVTGAIRGLTRKEISEKFDQIVDFAELDKFIDSPVQSYSSGMQVRLGFAVASSLKPDILLMDEVLAVGDAAFRVKCHRKLDELRPTTAIVLVSHNMQQIGNACTRVVVLDHGVVVANENVEEGIKVYDRLNLDSPDKPRQTVQRVGGPFVSAEFDFADDMSYGDTFKATLTVKTANPVKDFFIRIKIRAPDKSIVAEITNEQEALNLAAGESRLDILSEKLFLRTGEYMVDIAGHLKGAMEAVIQHRNAHSLTMTGKSLTRDAYLQLPATLKMQAGSPP